MKTIHKLTLEFTHSVQEIEMPMHSQIFTVASQKGKPCIWYMVDTTEVAVETRSFYMVGTGHSMPVGPDRNITFWGTMFFEDDTLVFHIFETGEPT